MRITALKDFTLSLREVKLRTRTISEKVSADRYGPENIVGRGKLLLLITLSMPGVRKVNTKPKVY
jgi:hypothetical protein